MGRFRYLPFSLLLLLTLAVSGQENLIDEKSSPGNSIELKVQLLDDLTKLKLPAYCGVFEPVNMTFNFQVIKVIEGKYKYKTIRINFRCPRELIDNKTIQNGEIKQFKLKKRSTSAEDKSKNGNEPEYELAE